MELKFMNLKDYKLMAAHESHEPIVEELLMRKELMLFHAAAKTGKSMFALNLGLAVATGSDFLGMATERSKVMYLQTEISPGPLSDRIDSMLRGKSEAEYDLAQQNLLICDQRIRVDQSEGIERLKAQLIAELPSVLILDPFYELHRKNEDNATEIAPILCELRAIAREVGCAILLIHHQGKKNEGGSPHAGHACRGSSAFADVPDSSVSLTRDKGGYCLRGVFRNRQPMEDFRLVFDENSFTFSLGEGVPRKARTRDLILEMVGSKAEGLTKKEISDNLFKSGRNVQSSAVQKQLETLRAEGVIGVAGTFKNTRFHALNSEGGNSSP